jgi:predicted peptidase
MTALKYTTGIVLPALLLVAFLQQVSAQTSRFSINQFISKQDTLHYRMLFPDADNMQKYPLVIFLHGSGERGSDNEAQLKWGVQNFATDENMAMHPCFVIAPQCPLNTGWGNFDGKDKSADLNLKAAPTKTMSLLIELIHDMAKNPSIDTNRIYITGLSMGGFGTYDAIERYPNLFAAAVPVCGGGDVSKATTISKIPIWIFHGAEDPAVNPAFSVSMVEALVKAGAHPGFTQYPSVGHFSWLAAYKDPLMMEWLFRQHK